MKLVCLTLVLAAAALAGCGAEGAAPGSAPGSPENPLPGTLQSGNEGDGRASAAPRPGFRAIVESQSRGPRSRFTPCGLVTKSQAQDILGRRIHDPVEAPQGPTCIYRSRDGEQFITLALQKTPFDPIKRRLADQRAVEVAGRTGRCGRYGQPMLYVPLSGGRILSVAGRCSTAKRFAAMSLGRIAG